MLTPLHLPQPRLQPVAACYTVCKFMPWLNMRVDIHRVRSLSQAELLLAEQLRCAQQMCCDVHEDAKTAGLFHVEFPYDGDNGYSLFIRREEFGFSLN